MGLDIWFCKKNANYDESKSNDLMEQILEIDKLLYSGGKVTNNEEEIKALTEKQRDLQDKFYDVSYVSEDDEVLYLRGAWFVLSYFGYVFEDNRQYKDIDKRSVEQLVENLRKVVSLNKSDFHIGDDYIDECNSLIGGFDDIEWVKGVTILDDEFKDVVTNILHEFERVLNTFDWEHDTLVMYAWC